MTAHMVASLAFNVSAALAAIALLAMNSYLGLGPGGMERMAAYPILLWTIGFGGYLMGAAGSR